MAITEQQVRHFREHGYVAVPRFFEAAEVAAMQAEIERLKREGLLNNVATEGDGVTPATGKLNLQLCPMSPHSPLFRAIPFAPKVIESVRALLGDPVVLHLDQVFLKPGRHGAGTNWHQDNAYFKIGNPLLGTAMWIAVHDATVANGTIHVVPDAYEELLPHERDPMSNHHIRCYPDESKAVPIELPAGGVAFFAYGTPHCTLGNSTDRDRAGVALHFLNANAVDNGYFNPDSSGQAMRHPVLTGPAASDGTMEYGESLAGAWGRDVAALAA